MSLPTIFGRSHGESLENVLCAPTVDAIDAAIEALAAADNVRKRYSDEMSTKLLIE